MLSITRREWLLAAACWSEVLRGQQTGWKSFDEATAGEIEAIAAQIIPNSDGTPGAREAGVIRFIDAALSGYDEDKRKLYTTGLANAQSRRATMFPGSRSIASLTGQQQIELLKAIEKTDFFAAVRTHTMLGFFGHPKHGGNRDGAGWKLIGWTDEMHYHPPFGFYDAEVSK